MSNPTARGGKPAVKSGDSDSDISLIAALVAYGIEHNSNPTAKAPVKSPTIKAVGKPPLKQKVAGKDATMNVQPVHESSADQLEKCHTQDFVDGEVCRWRVCAGKWDTDPACSIK